MCNEGISRGFLLALHAIKCVRTTDLILLWATCLLYHRVPFCISSVFYFHFSSFAHAPSPAPPRSFFCYVPYGNLKTGGPLRTSTTSLGAAAQVEAPRAAEPHSVGRSGRQKGSTETGSGGSQISPSIGWRRDGGEQLRQRLECELHRGTVDSLNAALISCTPLFLLS